MNDFSTQLQNQIKYTLYIVLLFLGYVKKIKLEFNIFV